MTTPSQDDAREAPASDDGKPRRPKRFTQAEGSVQRDADAMRLRAKGRTYEEIAEELGYGNRQNAHRAIRRHTERVTTPAVAELRAAMDAQLDQTYRAAVDVLEATHLRLHDGEPVTVDGERVTDDTPILRAVETLLRVQERRAKLWGLDAPAKIDATVSTVTVRIEGAEDV